VEDYLAVSIFRMATLARSHYRPSLLCRSSPAEPREASKRILVTICEPIMVEIIAKLDLGCSGSKARSIDKANFNRTRVLMDTVSRKSRTYSSKSSRI
jgi:hypothetical protein